MNSPPIVTAVRDAGFPAYDKIKHSFVVHGDRTGVMLRPEAYDAVEREYPDFAHALPEAKLHRKKRTTPENRQKQNRLVCRLDDATFDRVRRWMQEDGFDTNQDFIEECIRCYGITHGKDFL